MRKKQLRQCGHMFKHIQRRGHRMVLGVFAIFALSGLVVMLLWNALMPGLAGAGSINYLQAAGLLVLCRILFGGLGHAFYGHGRRGRLHAMDPEQREILARHLAERCAGHPHRECFHRAHARKDAQRDQERPGEGNGAAPRDGE